MHGGNGWNAENHGAKKPRKTRRKRLLAFDPNTGDVVGSKLTTERIGDGMELPDLIAEIDAAVRRFLEDGAYDGEAVSACLAAKLGPDIEVIVPPPKNAVFGRITQSLTA